MTMPPNPFQQDLHQTSGKLWASLVLLCLGAASLGAALVSLHYCASILAWVFLAVGLVLEVAGAVLAWHEKMMSDVA